MTALAERGGGTMVFADSIGGLVGVQQQAVYGSAKAALHHPVRCSDLAGYVTGNVLTLDGGAHFVPSFPDLVLRP